MARGQCHCGVIHFEISAEAVFSTICHCSDCRRQSGAPLLAWAMVRRDAVSISGKPKRYQSSDSGQRYFCEACGTGLFFTNGQLEKMGMMQVRIGALDNPNEIAPRAQVQTAERIEWMKTAHELPAFERFPG